jgi:ABC-type phosphate transport system substrate-binding protein
MTRSGGTVLGLVLALTFSTGAVADVVPIVSAKSTVAHLSRNAIADLFLGRAVRFPDGTRALPIDQEEGSAARDEFYTTFAGKSPAQLKAHWSKIIFTGRGRPPTAVASGIDARKLVAADPNAIAYIDRSLMDGSVKALKID